MRKCRAKYISIEKVDLQMMIYEWQIRGTDTNTDLQIQITQAQIETKIYKSLCIYLCIVFYKLRNFTFVCEYF